MTQPPPPAALPPEFVLARLVAAMRRHRGLSQRALAERLGIAGPSVSALENGRSTVSVPMLDALGAALDVPGLAVHALLCDLITHLERKGHPVAIVSWRQARGASVPWARNKPANADRSARNVPALDELLAEWLAEAPLARAVLEPEEHVIVHADVPWNPLPVEQRMGRIDRSGSPPPPASTEGHFAVMDFALRSTPPTPDAPRVHQGGATRTGGLQESDA